MFLRISGKHVIISHLPCHYFTSPGLSWDAMVKMTDLKLELMTHVDMFQFVEKGM